jgi:hypothetical protein
MSVTLVNFFNFNPKDTIMKTSILNTLIITAALAATSGFAQAAPSSQYHDAGASTVSNTSRAAVKADYLNAQAAGTLVQLGGQDTFVKAPSTQAASQLAKSRTDVKRELQMAQNMPARGEAAFTF